MINICCNYGCEQCKKTFIPFADNIDDRVGEDGKYSRLHEEEGRSQSGKMSCITVTTISESQLRKQCNFWSQEVSKDFK